MSFPLVKAHWIERSPKVTSSSGGRPMTSDQATILGVGMLIGLMVGLGIAMLRDYFRTHDAKVEQYWRDREDGEEGEDDGDS